MNGINDSETLSSFISYLKNYYHYFREWAGSGVASLGEIYIHVIRWVMPVLAILILLTLLIRMLRVRNPKEVWGYLVSDSLGRFSINHWECTVGRAKHCDIIVKFATISRTQCSLIRNDKGEWFVYDLSNRGSTKVNGETVTGKTLIKHEDVMSIGGIDFTFKPLSKQELETMKERRKKRSVPKIPWLSLLLLTLFQFLTTVEFYVTRRDSFSSIAFCFFVLTAAMWFYVLSTRIMGQKGFEPEVLAFFACTLNLAVTASSNPAIMPKQTIAILMGMAGFIMLGWYLRDINRVKKTRHLAAYATVAVFLINIVFGITKFGSSNWISIGGLSIQPSEIGKVLFIFAGAATLDRLFVKRNLLGFMCLSGACLLALAIVGDFGTASIFFVVFLVIAFLRSGDFATLSLITGAAAGAAMLVIRFKPYVASRFTTWGAAWDNVNTTGYQQVRTMSASASGGLIGVGAGNGWLKNVGAANTDLVFGIIAEEWGLIIALLAVLIIVVLSIFSFRVVQPGRSSYYTIAASAATSLFVFQTILNVFGSVDILPLTGVTFPFVSCGGTSMIACWCLLAFLKAADTRQNASFAVRRKTAAGEVPDLPAVDELAKYYRVGQANVKEEAKKRRFFDDLLSKENDVENEIRNLRSRSDERKQREKEREIEELSQQWPFNTSIPDEASSAEEFWADAKQKPEEILDEQEEIERFFKQFEEIEQYENEFFGNEETSLSDQIEIDGFFSQFNDIENDQEDWRLGE